MFLSFDGLSGFRALAHPVRFSEMTTRQPKRPPALGEHTREVLAELGYAAAEIDTLCDGVPVGTQES